eukprot:GCRY01003205.1.p1 GENE.GCRY01003205.1~~GCRY01003205.1.p1  ORF type:complete len:325 (+),score=51.78 GCRY01003205.1:283-1257(+)
MGAEGDSGANLFWKYFNGGASSCIATGVVHPVDVIKNRLMSELLSTKRSTVPSTIKEIVQNQGVRGFYDGLSAGLLRQAVYGTLRLGITQQLFVYAKRFSGKNDEPIPFLYKSLCGVFGGAIGAFFGTPADVAVVRMATDKHKALADRRNYKNVVDAWRRMAREEGVTSLWKGGVPTVQRAVVLGALQLPLQMHIIDYLKRWFPSLHERPNTDLRIVFPSTFLTGAAVCLSTQPIEFSRVILADQKTKLASVAEGAVKEESGVVLKSISDVLVHTVRTRGPLGVYRGCAPYFGRVFPHTVISLWALSVMNELLLKTPQLTVAKM